jgi:hypothetical protein
MAMPFKLRGRRAALFQKQRDVYNSSSLSIVEIKSFIISPNNAFLPGSNVQVCKEGGSSCTTKVVHLQLLGREDVVGLEVVTAQI